MPFIYKLDLEGGKYYFGLTDGNENDVKRHFYGEGCEWTRRHKPIRCEYVNGDEVDMIYWILTFMRTYGYNNVRGGYWEQTEPYKNPPPVLGRFCKGRTKYNKCDKCLQYGHSDNRCHIRYDAGGDVIM